MDQPDPAQLRRKIEALERQRDDAIRSRDGYKTKLHETRARLEQIDRMSAALEHRRLRRRWIVPVNQPMVLISQVQRSGGTLLNRLFDGHPECFSHPMELKWGRPRKWNWPSFDPRELTDKAAFELLDETWTRKAVQRGGYAKYSAWTDHQKSADRRLYPFVFDRELHQEVFADAYPRGGSASRRAVLDAYLTGLFNAWLDYQNLYAAPKRWVASFIPWLITETDSVERFFADYPDGLLITVVRDPKSWLASATRHTFSSEPGETLRQWTRSTQASLAAAERYRDRVLLLLFEELVGHTEATMRALCARLGVAFTTALLQPTYNSMPVLSNSSFEMATGIDRTAARRSASWPPELDQAARREADERYDEAASRFRLHATSS